MKKSTRIWVIVIIFFLIVMCCFISSIIGGIIYFSGKRSATPLQVGFISPDDGQTFTLKDDQPLKVEVQLKVENDENLKNVKVYINDDLKKTISDQPYKFTWKTSQEGDYSLRAWAYNKSGRLVKSGEISIKVEKEKSEQQEDSPTQDQGKETEKKEEKAPPPPPKPKGYPSPEAAVKAKIGSDYITEVIKEQGNKATVRYGPPASEWIGAAICRKLEDGSWVVEEWTGYDY